MTKSRLIFILLAGVFVSMAAQAEDVCDARPDLCGRPARAIKGHVKKKKKKVKTRRCADCTNETARLADEMERELIEEQANDPARRNIAQEGDAVPSMSSLSKIARRPHQEVRRKQKPMTRQTANSFDAYLNSNSRNPSLAARVPSAQSAFQPRKGSSVPAQNRPDPVVIAQPFAGGSGPNPTTGGFSSAPMTLNPTVAEPAAPGPEASAPDGQMPVQPPPAEQPPN